MRERAEMRILWTVAIIAMSVGVVKVAPGASSYSITDLGSLGGTSSRAYGINDLGQVVGRSAPPTVITSHAFLYDNGVMSDLGTLGGNYAAAWAINDSGVIVGQSRASDIAYSPRQAFSYSNGVMAYLGQGLDWNTWTESYAISVNSSGQVVGYRNYKTSDFPLFPPPDTRATGFIYSGESMTMLSPPPGYNSTEALGINDSGQIVGVYWDTGFTYPDEVYAFTYSNGVYTRIASGARADTAYYQDGAFDINNHGDVIGIVGGYWSDLPETAFVYRNGETTYLGTEFRCFAIIAFR
jgi:probable HAF family extracellular repeat protein